MTARPYLLPFFEFIEMMDAIVADSDALDLPLCDSLHQSCPCTQSFFFPSIRGMEEIEVDIVESSLSKSLVDTFLGLFVALVRRHLGREEKLIPRKSRSEHAFRRRLLISVNCGRINLKAFSVRV